MGRRIVAEGSSQWPHQVLSREFSKIDDPELNLELACLAERNNREALRLGLPPIGAKLLNQHGLEFVVLGHSYLPTTETVQRWNEGERALPEDLFPLIGLTNTSDRLNELLIAVDRSTTRTILIVDTMPGIRPGAVPGHHFMDACVHPDAVVVFLDAARAHETVIAHEIGHAWVQYVDDCEDLRVLEDTSNPVRLHQLSFIQSFVLDLKVNELLRKKGFDMSPINMHIEQGINDIGRLLGLGFKPPTRQEELLHALLLAAQQVERSRGNSAGLIRFDETLAKLRRIAPDTYELTMSLSAAVQTFGFETKDCIKKAIDECLRLGFDFTGDSFDLDVDLIVPPRSEPSFDKFPNWIKGAYPKVKALIGSAMAREGIPVESKCRLADAGEYALLSFELPDGTVRGPWSIPHPFAEWLHRQHAKEALKINEINLAMQEKMRQDIAKMNAENAQKRVDDYYRLTGQRLPGTPTDPGGHTPSSPFNHGLPGRRPYMAGLGRFLTRARLEEILGGEHPYAYAMNNPVTYTDSSGLKPSELATTICKRIYGIDPKDDPTGCRCCVAFATIPAGAPCSLQNQYWANPSLIPIHCIAKQCGVPCANLIGSFLHGPCSVFGAPAEWYIGIQPGTAGQPFQIGAGLIVRF